MSNYKRYTRICFVMHVKTPEGMEIYEETNPWVENIVDNLEGIPDFLRYAYWEDGDDLLSPDEEEDND